MVKKMRPEENWMSNHTCHRQRRMRDNASNRTNVRAVLKKTHINLTKMCWPLKLVNLAVVAVQGFLCTAIQASEAEARVVCTYTHY